MIVTISYDISELEETARFIWENNPNIVPIADSYNWITPDGLVRYILILTYQLIQYNARIMIDETKTGILSPEFQTSTGTMGFIISTHVESNENNVVSFRVDFLVNPAIGKYTPSIVTEVIDFINE